MAEIRAETGVKEKVRRILNNPQTEKSVHKITTQQVTSKTSLIFVDGKLAMVTSLVSPEFDDVIRGLVESMMHKVFNHGVKAEECLSEGQ